MFEGGCIERGGEETSSRILHAQGVELLIGRLAGANF